MFLKGRREKKKWPTDAKKWPTDANFQTPASTGRKVEMASTYAAFENIMGKGENAGKQHFLLFPLCFLDH